MMSNPILSAELLDREGREAQLTLITREGNALPMGVLVAANHGDMISRVLSVALKMVGRNAALRGLEPEIIDPYL